MTDLYRFVSDDVKGSAPSLENLTKLLLHERGDLKPLLNETGDNIIGFESKIGGTNITSYNRYSIRITKPGTMFVLECYDNVGVVAHYEGESVERVYQQVNAKFQTKLDREFAGRAGVAKFDLNRLIANGAIR